MRLGIFGGSFDPVHFGHLVLAERCREECTLDEVWFLPAATAPHKLHRDCTPAHHRVEMLQLALGGHVQMIVSTLEIDRRGISYTVDSLEEIHHRYPGNELFLLLGADSLHELPTWREPDRICQLAQPVVVRRGGGPESDFSVLSRLVAPARLAEIKSSQVRMPLIDLCSSDLRQRVRHGRSIRYHTPRAVEKYIETNAIYRSP